MTFVFVVASGHMMGVQGSEAWAENHRDLLDRCRFVLNVEHMAGREVADDGAQGLRFTGAAEPQLLQIGEDPAVLAMVGAAIDARTPRNTVVYTSSLPPFTDIAPYLFDKGEVREGLRYASFNGVPLYLLDDEDDLDKILVAELRPKAQLAAQILVEALRRP